MFVYAATDTWKRDVAKPALLIVSHVCVQGEGIMFLFTDSQIVDEKMLVYVNDLLSSGEIPDLFAQEDKDEIINAVRSETKALGLVDTAENCWSTFIQKVTFT